MKINFTILILVLFGLNSLYSTDKNQNILDNQRAIDMFKRLKESAHPTPINDFKTFPDFLQENTNILPYFLNANTISDEGPTTVGRSQNESSIAVNPLNPKNLIASAVDYRDNSSTWVYVSDDGGKSWRNINLKKPFTGWASTNDPSVFFANDGTGYLVYGGFGNVTSSPAGLVGENGVFISRTTDEGKTWESHLPVILHRGAMTLDSAFEDKYYIQVDNSNNSQYHSHLYVPWKRVTPRDSATQIVISKSTNQGSSWSAPIPLSPRLSGSSEDTTFGQSFPLATTGPNGEVYVVWNNGIAHGIGFAKSLDGGQTYTPPKIIQKYNIFGETIIIPNQGYRHSVKKQVRAEAYPVVVCDITNGERNGNIYLCWAADNYPNIYFARSTDKGESWSKPIFVHSDTTNDQFWPWLAIDPTNGDLAIMYLDSRNDENNILVECYVSYSSDGGITWIDRQAADISSDLRYNPFTAGSFAGDYNGCAFYNGIIYPSWVDMRFSKYDIQDSDVFTAIINTRAPAPPDNFIAHTNTENVKIVELSWKNPIQSSFGKILKDEDYSILLKRDGLILANFAGGKDTTFVDLEAIPFNENKYEIYSYFEADTSSPRKISVYPGGSEKPNPPSMTDTDTLYKKDNPVFSVKIPTTRTDKITLLSNLNKLKLYIDGKYHKSYEISNTDLGNLVDIELKDLQIKNGYYNFQFTVSDFFENTNISTESELSNMINKYYGTVEFYTDNFEEVQFKHHFGGNWQLTDEFSHSKIHCVTESPNGNYKGMQRDTLLLIPTFGNGKLNLTFYHSAITDKDDSCFVEISYNNMLTWEKIVGYNGLSYPEWGDNVLDERDWIYEKFPIEKIAEKIFVRFIFRSNPVRHSDGWYIDDVVLNAEASAENNDETQIKLFPIPAKDYISLTNTKNKIKTVKLYSTLGNIIEIKENTVGNNQLFFDIKQLSQGIYLFEIISQDNVIIRKTFIKQ